MKLQGGRSFEFDFQEDEGRHCMKNKTKQNKQTNKNSHSKEVKKSSRYSGQDKQISLSTCQLQVKVIMGGKTGKKIKVIQEVPGRGV